MAGFGSKRFLQSAKLSQKQPAICGFWCFKFEILGDNHFSESTVLKKVDIDRSPTLGNSGSKSPLAVWLVQFSGSFSFLKKFVEIQKLPKTWLDYLFERISFPKLTFTWSCLTLCILLKTGFKIDLIRRNFFEKKLKQSKNHES